MRPVICFQQNKGRAETMDAQQLLPVDTKWGKKKGIRTQLRERGENESRGERTNDQVVVFTLFFMEAKSSLRFHVVISISNYPIPKRLHPFREPGFPSKRRMQTWMIILLLCFILTWLQIAYMYVASPLNSYKSVSELCKYFWNA